MSSYLNDNEKQLQRLRKMRNQEMRITLDRLSISSEVRLYSIDDLTEMSGWSRKTVAKMFSDPSFPSLDYGRTKLVEAHALIEYFSVKHERERDRFWR